MTKYYDIDYAWDLPLSKMDKDAAEVCDYMKKVEGWKEVGIGLFVDESRLYLLDCNSVVVSVYQRHDTSYQWYCGFDASGVASIRTVIGLRGFLEDFKRGEFAGMGQHEPQGYLEKMRNDYPDNNGQRIISYDELKALEGRMMAELGWVYNAEKKRWYKS